MQRRMGEAVARVARRVNEAVEAHEDALGKAGTPECKSPKIHSPEAAGEGDGVAALSPNPRPAAERPAWEEGVREMRVPSRCPRVGLRNEGFFGGRARRLAAAGLHLPPAVTRLSPG